MIRRPFHPLAAVVTCVVLLGACAKGERASNQPADSTARNLTLAPSESSGAMRDVPVPNKVPAARPPEKPPTRPAPPATVTVASGTHLDIAVTDTITSRRNQPGDVFTARIVYDEPGARVAGIPEGAELRGTIVDVKPAPNPRTPGTLTLAVSSITIRGKRYDVQTRIDSLETVRQGRGVTSGDAAKVGIGAVAGGILGRVIGGNTKGTIIGGIVGAAAGAGVAAHEKDSDIVLPAGAHVHVTLMKALTVAAR
jgi:hypothetical protein